MAIQTALSSQTITREQLAKTIDHSLLYTELTEDDIVAGCELARHYQVASVAVKPCYVARAAQVLRGSGVAVGATIGFPHGVNTTAVKAFEAQDAMANGATELDMVINVGELRSGHANLVQKDIRAVVDIGGHNALVKVIIETAYLTDEQKVLACKLVENAGADFVKNSTGFAPAGYKKEDLILMRASVGPRMQVKASAGVRTLDLALEAIDIGCTRIGTIGTAAILDEFERRHPE